MSILTVRSTNPDLSWILEKNPATIRDSKKPYVKTLRQGVVYGWFLGEKADAFRMWFRDSDLKSSFADGLGAEFEYLDATRYASPYLPISIMTNCLATALKHVHEKDTSNYVTTVIMTIKIPKTRDFVNLARSYDSVPGVIIGAFGVTNDNSLVIDEHEDPSGFYNVLVTAPGVNMALNIACVVCVMQAMGDADSDVTLTKEAVEKYLNCLNAAKAPYYPRYLFSSRAINNRSVFERLKPKLDAEGMKFQFGNTRQQRFDAIAKVIGRGGDTLVDIGAGEGFYSFKLFGKFGVTFAIDKDPDVADMLTGMAKRRQLTDKIEPMHADVTPEWVNENQDIFDGADVLLTEVVEHMSIPEASALVRAILKTNFKRLIITTPDRNFNVNYGFQPLQMRHPDHKWELSHEEFVAWINGMVHEVEHPYGFSRYWMPMTDKVNGVQVTSGVVITPQTEALNPANPVNFTIEIADPDPAEIPRSEPVDTLPSESQPV